MGLDVTAPARKGGIVPCQIIARFRFSRGHVFLLLNFAIIRLYPVQPSVTAIVHIKLMLKNPESCDVNEMSLGTRVPSIVFFFCWTI